MRSRSTTDITWFPNAWIRLRVGKRIVHFDPAYLTTYFSKYPDKTEFSKWPGPIDGLPNGLGKADFIFITHHHKDHCKKVTAERLSHARTRIFAPKSCVKELGNTITIVEPGETIEVARDVRLSVVHAYNTPQGTSTRKQHRKGKGVGYVLTLGGMTYYHLGDTDHLPEMGSLKDIDVAFVPMGGKFTMDPDEAVRATIAIGPRIVVPVHDLGRGFGEFENKLRSKAPKIKCLAPAIGQVITL